MNPLKWMGCLLLLSFYTHFSHAQSIRQIGPNLYWVGIPTEEFNSIQARSMNAGKQMQSNWCWAASIQMVLNYHGLFTDQIHIVKRLYGHTLQNGTATEDQILMSLSNWSQFQQGKSYKVIAESGPSSVHAIVQELANKWPLIVGVKTLEGGHALVLTGIIYQVTPSGELQPRSVELRDPWPGIPSQQELSWNRFEKACTSLIRVSVKEF